MDCATLRKAETGIVIARTDKAGAVRQQSVRGRIDGHSAFPTLGY